MTHTVADVLHLAADKYLVAHDNDCLYGEWYGERYSCIAMKRAAHELCVSSEPILKGLEEMGCDTDSSMLFHRYGDNRYSHIIPTALSPNTFSPTVQGMRYFWLKWAAKMAEEQGI